MIASEMPCAVISHTSHCKSRRSHLQTSSSFLKASKHSSVIACFNRRQPCALSHHELLPLGRCLSLACTFKQAATQHNNADTHPPCSRHVLCSCHVLGLQSNTIVCSVPRASSSHPRRCSRCGAASASSARAGRRWWCCGSPSSVVRRRWNLPNLHRRAHAQDRNQLRVSGHGRARPYV
jgi:hypothetical protein